MTLQLPEETRARMQAALERLTPAERANRAARLNCSRRALNAAGNVRILEIRADDTRRRARAR